VEAAASPVCAVLHTRRRAGNASDFEADASKRGEELSLDGGKETCAADRTAAKPPQRTLGGRRIQHRQAAEQPIDRRLERGPGRESGANLVQGSADVGFGVACREPAGERVYRPERGCDRTEILNTHRAPH
jgi:hypothetical protein